MWPELTDKIPGHLITRMPQKGSHDRGDSTILTRLKSQKLCWVSLMLEMLAGISSICLRSPLATQANARDASGDLKHVLERPVSTSSISVICSIMYAQFSSSFHMPHTVVRSLPLYSVHVQHPSYIYTYHGTHVYHTTARNWWLRFGCERIVYVMNPRPPYDV